jgi:hypothetical protein
LVRVSTPFSLFIIKSDIPILFKNSIENKNIPNEWREGCITALFKKGSRKMASNYRPVSLTCILCEVLEKGICFVFVTIG